jgi:hypothetical protein
LVQVVSYPEAVVHLVEVLFLEVVAAVILVEGEGVV